MYYIIAIASTGSKDEAIINPVYLTDDGVFSPDKELACKWAERADAEYNIELVGDLTEGYKPLIVYSPVPTIS